MTATTETHCHCGVAFNGSDHCPECFCEQYEAYCDYRAEGTVTRVTSDCVVWDVYGVWHGEERVVFRSTDVYVAVHWARQRGW